MEHSKATGYSIINAIKEVYAIRAKEFEQQRQKYTDISAIAKVYTLLQFDSNLSKEQAEKFLSHLIDLRKKFYSKLYATCPYPSLLFNKERLQNSGVIVIWFVMTSYLSYTFFTNLITDDLDQAEKERRHWFVLTRLWGLSAATAFLCVPGFLYTIDKLFAEGTHLNKLSKQCATRDLLLQWCDDVANTHEAELKSIIKR